jgi:hypothetical protein
MLPTMSDYIMARTARVPGWFGPRAERGFRNALSGAIKARTWPVRAPVTRPVRRPSGRVHAGLAMGAGRR